MKVTVLPFTKKIKAVKTLFDILSVVEYLKIHIRFSGSWERNRNWHTE